MPDLTDTRLALEPYLRKLSAFRNADELAEFLTAEGVTGYRGTPYACPIAHYLQDASGLSHVLVFCRSTMVRLPATAAKWHRETVSQHTTAMRDFISRFDQRRYPQLDGDHGR